jgi:hypothetical protein
MELALSTGLILLAVFPVLLLIGIPISVTIGISSVLSILTALPWEKCCIYSSTTYIYRYKLIFTISNTIFRTCRNNNEQWWNCHKIS